MKAIVAWWKRRTEGQKILLLLLVVVLAVTGAVTPPAEDDPKPAPISSDSTLGLREVSATAPAADRVHQPASTVATALSTTTTSPPTTRTIAPGEHEARVVSVVDGDTIVVADSGGAEDEVRLIGIDTPETGEKFSQEAADALEGLVGYAVVWLETDVEIRDQYDRLLAYVWVDDAMANEGLLRQGLGTVYTLPPNVKYVERFQAAQDEAEATESGVWGSASDSPLRIVAVEYDAPGDDSLNLNEEYIAFEVLVSGTLAGYSVEDETGHRYQIADCVFQKGDVFKLHSGEGADTESDLYWGAHGAAIWNNDGDMVKVLDSQDKIVESYDY